MTPTLAYDRPLTPTLTLAVMGPTAILAYDGDLLAAARLHVRDLRALRRALDEWEDALLAQQAGGTA